MAKQRTIKQPILFNGFGIHSAKFAEVTISPMPENSGINFRDQSAAVKYSPQNIQADARGTQINLTEDKQIMTVEHLVSALAGLEIDNVMIDIEGPEVPIKDGSPLFFVEKILEAGIVEQEAPRNTKGLAKTLALAEKDKFIIATPAENFKITFLLDYPHKGVVCELASYSQSPQNYQLLLGRARTFGLKEEVRQLWENNKGLGATLDNALVIDEQGYSSQPNYPNELARHKIVDFIGDIMAIGYLPKADFLVAKSGHQFNQLFVKEFMSVNA